MHLYCYVESIDGHDVWHPMRLPQVPHLNERLQLGNTMKHTHLEFIDHDA